MGETLVMANYIIETDKLSYRSGQRYLLRDIDWKVEAGQHWCLFGMNGCGKTTLLSIIAGYKTATSGCIKVFGEEFCNSNILAQRQRIGWVSSSFFDRYFQKEPALNIVLSGKTGSFGVDFSLTDGDVRNAKLLLKEFGLKDKIRQPFSLMSKGERQNVLLARALLSNPEILILDEPCSGLDVIARERVLELVEVLAEQTNMTIIYVTHYVEEILPDFQQTVLMRAGEFFATGFTSTLFTDACLSEFLQHPVTVHTTDTGRSVVQTQATFKSGKIAEGWCMR